MVSAPHAEASSTHQKRPVTANSAPARSQLRGRRLLRPADTGWDRGGIRATAGRAWLSVSRPARCAARAVCWLSPGSRTRRGRCTARLYHGVALTSRTSPDAPVNSTHQKVTLIAAARMLPTTVSIATMSVTTCSGRTDGPMTEVITARTSNPPGTVPCNAPTTGLRRSATAGSRWRIHRIR